jgi:hydrophobic/amphiphilic exporter-1 (mainly G- bacteria), HAE1 family
MSISEIFIRRPVMTTLVMIGILVFGVMAYGRLPVSDLPAVDFPTITVRASLPGASPETMASAVATPLEREFTTIAGIDNMTSTSNQGSTQITVQFALERDIDAAAQDVQAAISKTLRNLPQGILTPSMQKVNPADQPILFLALTSDLVPLSELDRIGQTVIAQRISTVQGVAQVSVNGSQKYAVRLRLDPTALSARGLGIDEVSNAVARENVNLPTGVLWGPKRAFTVQANGQMTNADAFKRLIVAYRNGAPVHLQELGDIVDGVENDKVASWYNGSRSIVLSVQRQPGTNTVEVAKNVLAMVDRLKSQIPPTVTINKLYDRSEGIEQSVNDVKFTLLLTLALVVMVIFLFLRNLSATVIPSLALPMSVVGTFAVMYLLGFSLDNLSLMALTLAVGFVVDDAIVMLENIVRHLEMGKPPMQAAFDGAKEIGFTILSMTISLVAVFIPLLFMSGIIGRLFNEFAVTIGVAILVSGFVSLTLTPMLCGRYLKPHRDVQHGRMYNATERVYDRIVGAYSRSLNWVMRHRRASLVFSLGILVLTVYLFKVVPKGFIPNSDTGRILITTEGAQGISFTDMAAHQQELAAIVAKNPHVKGYMSALGGGSAASNNNQGRIFMTLKPREERPPAEQIMGDLRRQLAQVPGMNAFPQIPPVIQIGGRSSRAQYQFTMQSSDLDELYPAAQTMTQQMREMPILQDVSSDLQVANPQVDVKIDRERAAAMGVTAEQIESALYDAYGARQVSTIYASDDQYMVIMELQPQFQRDIPALNLLYVRSQRGDLVPLSAVATLTPGVGPLSVNHSGQLPSVTVSFNTKEGVSLGDAVSAVEAAAVKTLPTHIATSFSGTAQAFQDTQRGLLALLFIAIFVIYMVLGILYESFIHPLTILSGLPFAAVGALLALLVTGMELDVYSFVGIILLIGLVKKNAIMMIDFALEAERKEGKSPEEAIVEACIVRFRPIMMTTMAALMGTLPIAIGHGAGAEARRPLGIAVVGGLLFSQFITLYVTPVFYTYLDRAQKRFSRRKQVQPEAEGAGSGPAIVPKGNPGYAA